MGLAYEDLDDDTRRFMAREIELDVAEGTIYMSRYFNDNGCASWPDLIAEAAAHGDDDTLAFSVRENDCFKSHYDRKKPKGGFASAAVPYNAHETIAEGEFNRFYCRALCARAIEEGIPYLEVYRAKSVLQPRPGSEEKLGSLVDPAIILNDLRATQGVEPALGLPPGPNSGLTLRFPR